MHCECFDYRILDIDDVCLCYSNYRECIVVV